MRDNNHYYDNLSKTYVQISEKRKKYLDSIDQEILNFLRSINVSSILDVGLGDGRRSNKYIKTLNFSEKNFYGLEPSSKMYLKALNNLKEITNVYNKNVESYETNKKFNVIMCLWNVIGHVSNLEIFIKKISKLSEHNGYFIFDFNNIYNLQTYGIKNFLSNLLLSLFKTKYSYKVVHENNDTMVNYYKPSYISKILSLNNFQIIKKIHINYQNGTICNFLNGQILLICKYESK